MRQNKLKAEQFQLQISFEMMVITSVIISFSLVGLGLYNHFTKTQNIVYSSFIDNTLNTSSLKLLNFSTNGSLNIYGSIANITYINQSNNLQIIFSLPYQSDISIKILNNDNIISIPESYNFSAQGVGAASFSIIPKHIGLNIINVSVLIKNNSNQDYIYKNLTLKTYSKLSNNLNNSNAFSLFSFSIIRHNESLVYPLQKQQDIYSISSWNFCEQWNTPSNQWNGHPPNLCGTQYFYVDFSFCKYPIVSYTYYCVQPIATNNYFSKINNSHNFFYNITLNISGLSKFPIYSNLSNFKNNENISLNNKIIGNINVNNISGEGQMPYLNYFIFNNSKDNYVINIINYSPYVQAFENFNSTIEYYNGHLFENGVNPSIQQDINYFNDKSSNFIKSQPIQNNQCNLLNLNKTEFYSCRPFSLLNYIFTFDIYNKTISNITVNSQGSILYIKNQS